MLPMAVAWLLGVIATFVVLGNVQAPIRTSGDASTPATSPVAESHTATKGQVLIRRPVGPPRIKTGGADALGNPTSVSCVACHSTQAPQPSVRTSAELDQFHQGLVYKHGDQSCLACHNRDDYNALRLADGSTLQFTDVMKLCAQCHGTQFRDYQHGAHGGMTGYWDLTRGDRTRNSCIDCHDPHAPKYPVMLPVFKPNNRRPLAQPRGQTQEAGHE